MTMFLTMLMHFRADRCGVSLFTGQAEVTL